MLKKSEEKSPPQKSKSKSPSVEKTTEKVEENGKIEENKVEEKTEPVHDTVVEKKESRALHKTTSIFLRNLAPTITKAEVEAVSEFNKFKLLSVSKFEIEESSLII